MLARIFVASTDKYKSARFKSFLEKAPPPPLLLHIYRKSVRFIVQAMDRGWLSLAAGFAVHFALGLSIAIAQGPSLLSPLLIFIFFWRDVSISISLGMVDGRLKDDCTTGFFMVEVGKKLPDSKLIISWFFQRGLG